MRLFRNKSVELAGQSSDRCSPGRVQNVITALEREVMLGKGPCTRCSRGTNERPKFNSLNLFGGLISQQQV